MPVPSAISDLSQTAGSNYPAGSESPSTTDDYLRTYASYIAKLRDGQGHTNAVTLASAATTDIGGQVSQFVEISGTTTITSFGTNYNGPRFIRFTGALTLTHNATSLILPTGANITTVAGDTCIAAPNQALNGWTVYAYAGSSGRFNALSSSSGALNGSIGSTTPSTGAFTTLSATGSTFTINNANANVRFENGSGTRTGYIQSRADAFDIWNDQNTPMVFGTNNTERGRFTSTGLSVTGDLSTTGNVTLGDASTDTVTVNGYMGVGGAANSTIALNVAPTALTGTNQIGAQFTPAGTSAATSSVRGVFARADTAAAAFTATNVVGFWAADSTKGAGSTITNQHGVYIADQTQGTNNYGITSLVSSGTNKWNIYASGTAANYFAGNVGIGTNAPSTKLHVSDSVNGSGPVINLANTYYLASSTDERVDFQGEFYQNDVAANRAGGLMRFGKEGDFSANASASAFIAFHTRSAGTLAERMRIDSSGNLGLGVTPSASWSGQKAIQVGSGGSVSYGNGMALSNNAVHTSAGFASNYIATGAAALYLQGSGIHTWYTAPSGTAGNAITWTQAMTLDASGNLGLGVTPSAWNSSYKAIQYGSGGVPFIAGTTASAGSNALFGVNAYLDSGASWRYINSQVANLFSMENGAFKWQTAPSGTAGNAITFTQSLAVGLGTTLALEGATSATGTGIAFPATQNASSNANTLDDYEEGTFTPTIVGTSTAGTGTYSVQVGRYTKVGNYVFYSVNIAWSAHTGTGNMRVSALPFTSNSTASNNHAVAGQHDGMAMTAGNVFQGYIAPSSTQIILQQVPTGGGTAVAIPIDTAVTSLILSGHYEV